MISIAAVDYPVSYLLSQFLILIKISQEIQNSFINTASLVASLVAVSNRKCLYLKHPGITYIILSSIVCIISCVHS